MICKYKKCNTIASFNYKGEDKRIYCSKHKLDGMENVRYKFCGYDDCKNTRELKSKYCNEHSTAKRQRIIYDDIEVYAEILISIKNIEK